ncbi:hypothetical protein QEN19_000749 [Hanseniaspora menglaensis]
MLKEQTRTKSKTDIHKRLSQMEIEINELNDLLTENIDSSQKKRFFSNGLANTLDDIDSLEEIIVNDRIELQVDKIAKELDDEPEMIKETSVIEKSISPVSNNKANTVWAVYTNQEGRRIHEIPVKQKILELEKNPKSVSVITSSEPNSPLKKTENNNLIINADATIISKQKKETGTKGLLLSDNNNKQENCLSKTVTVEETKKIYNKSETPIQDHHETLTLSSPNFIKKSSNDISNRKDTQTVLIEKLSKDSFYKKQPKKNPFKVISVSNSEEVSFEKEDKTSSATEIKLVSDLIPSPGDAENVEIIKKTFEEMDIPSDIDIMLKLHDHLCTKILKLKTEIDYVSNIVNNHYSYSLTFHELNQFQNGNKILKNYLDKKYKQKYELELRLSSKFRKLKNEDKMNENLFFSNR